MRPQTRTTQAHSPPAPPPSSRALPLRIQDPTGAARAQERRPSISQRSIPISALVTPHAPSIGRASSAYHMRDSRRPPRQGGRCAFAHLKRRNRLFRLGCFMSPWCCFRFGGSLLFGGCRRRGSSAGRTRRRRYHWTTHRLSSLRSRVVYACWRSLNVDVNRCALLALPLSRNGGYLVGHLHPVYRMRRDLRMRRYTPPATTAAIPPPRYLGLGDCEFLIIIFHIFLLSIIVSAFFYVCTCSLVLVSHTVNRFIQNSHSFLYIVKIPTSLRLGSLHKVYHQYTICYANLVSHGAHYPLSFTRLCTHYRNRRPASPHLSITSIVIIIIPCQCLPL
jgi:hypothetical protein